MSKKRIYLYMYVCVVCSIIGEGRASLRMRGRVNWGRGTPVGGAYAHPHHAYLGGVPVRVGVSLLGSRLGLAWRLRTLSAAVTRVLHINIIIHVSTQSVHMYTSDISELILTASIYIDSSILYIGLVNKTSHLLLKYFVRYWNIIMNNICTWIYIVCMKSNITIYIDFLFKHALAAIHIIS